MIFAYEPINALHFASLRRVPSNRRHIEKTFFNSLVLVLCVPKGDCCNPLPNVHGRLSFEYENPVIPQNDRFTFNFLAVER